ncbi:hypothetical protein [uncultured Lactobacillus sp.]|uniref:hypothetical protein n=1 Tax=uncultured Lactobacillus sp. TaxID=153152 RepID=UPI0026665C5A|nr:hypothetical protein [uncultured Lactobacillus sp.]
MFNWLATYFACSNSLLLQALFFVFATDSTFFKQESPKKRAGKDILAFLLSFNTSTMLTVLLYDWLKGFPADVSPECKIIADKKESGKNSNE